MTTLQTISLGNPPDGSGGDTARSANSKVNANTAILDVCVELGYQIISANKTLAPADAGARIGLYFPVDGGVVVLPLANTVRQNGVIHFFNVGRPINIGFQGGDGSQITRINTWDWVKYVSDGSASWQVVARGRLSVDESIDGALTTVGEITSGGLLTAQAGAVVVGSLSVNRAAEEGDLQLGGNDGYFYGNSTSSGWYSPTKGSFQYTFSTQTLATQNLQIYGNATFGVRPTFAGKTPWDSGNFNPSGYASLSGSPAFSGRPTFAGNTPFDTGNFNPSSYTLLVGSSQVVVNLPQSSPGWQGATLILNGVASQPTLALISNSNTRGVQIRNSVAGQLDVIASDGGSWAACAAGSFPNMSDERFKSDVETAIDSLSKILLCRGVYYKEKSSGEARVGVIAQEIMGVFPEVVSVVSDEGHLAVDYAKLVGPLIEAVKSLADRIAMLEGKAKS
ncbi:tail fiber domain-containing protein [Burkholderia gladioli]|uniref:tail fiber domain-containing protein n=1 Tax=Burkholderia gladioli TaxID=28095 RepID=UPI00163FDCC8|nr:tail fiber domain-containing protein [Burkholderia gladioli]